MSDARLFVALELPVGARDALADWGVLAARRDPTLRATHGTGLHLTLHFLGTRSEDETPGLAAAVAATGAAATAPIALSLAGALWLAPGRPHVLTCSVRDERGALIVLHRSLGASLAAAAPGWSAEPRPLTPHVTVARVRRGAHPRSLTVPAAPPGSFSATHLTLFRSRTRRDGTRYEALERSALIVL